MISPTNDHLPNAVKVKSVSLVLVHMQHQQLVQSSCVILLLRYHLTLQRALNECSEVALWLASIKESKQAW